MKELVFFTYAKRFTDLSFKELQGFIENHPAEIQICYDETQKQLKANSLKYGHIQSISQLAKVKQSLTMYCLARSVELKRNNTSGFAAVEIICSEIRLVNDWDNNYLLDSLPDPEHAMVYFAKRFYHMLGGIADTFKYAFHSIWVLLQRLVADWTDSSSYQFACWLFSNLWPTVLTALILLTLYRGFWSAISISSSTIAIDNSTIEGTNRTTLHEVLEDILIEQQQPTDISENIWAVRASLEVAEQNLDRMKTIAKVYQYPDQKQLVDAYENLSNLTYYLRRTIITCHVDSQSMINFTKSQIRSVLRALESIEINLPSSRPSADFTIGCVWAMVCPPLWLSSNRSPYIIYPCLAVPSLPLVREALARFMPTLHASRLFAFETTNHNLLEARAHAFDKVMRMISRLLSDIEDRVDENSHLVQSAIEISDALRVAGSRTSTLRERVNARLSEDLEANILEQIKIEKEWNERGLTRQAWHYYHGRKRKDIQTTASQISKEAQINGLSIIMKLHLRFDTGLRHVDSQLQATKHHLKIARGNLQAKQLVAWDKFCIPLTGTTEYRESDLASEEDSSPKFNCGIEKDFNELIKDIIDDMMDLKPTLEALEYMGIAAESKNEDGRAKSKEAISECRAGIRQKREKEFMAIKSRKRSIIITDYLLNAEEEICQLVAFGDWIN